MTSNRLFLMGGLLVALSLAFLVSPLASTEPDGLNKVAADNGFDHVARDHAFENGPLAGYSVNGVESERLSKGLSGVIGVILTFGIGTILFAGIRLLRFRDLPPQSITNTPA